MSSCLFCDIVAGDVPAEIVHSTDLTVAFRDVNPAAPVHVLVVPRRHIENAAAIEAADAEVAAALFTTARAVAEAEGLGSTERGYRLVMNVGADSLNSVPHLHVHLLGGRPMGWSPA
jgi:histidine triad (HIT) family protein